MGAGRNSTPSRCPERDPRRYSVSGSRAPEPATPACPLGFTGWLRCQEGNGPGFKPQPQLSSSRTPFSSETGKTETCRRLLRYQTHANTKGGPWRPKLRVAQHTLPPLGHAEQRRHLLRRPATLPADRALGNPTECRGSCSLSQSVSKQGASSSFSCPFLRHLPSGHRQSLLLARNTEHTCTVFILNT